MLDAHCHLDFAPDAVALARAARARGGALIATCDPRDYERVAGALSAFAPEVRVGLGLHPWWVADGTCSRAEVELFERLSPSAQLISEVGLDFQPRRAGSEAVQLAAFERVCRAAARPLEGAPAGTRRVMSLHSSAAAGHVLAVLEKTGCLHSCTCIFHWFSGSQDELSRAIGAGCLFSVGPRMLSTKRGRAWARAIPAHRLLLETDEPAKPVAAFSPEKHSEQLQSALALLAQARGENASALETAMGNTASQLFASASSRLRARA